MGLGILNDSFTFCRLPHKYYAAHQEALDVRVHTGSRISKTRPQGWRLRPPRPVERPYR